MASFFQVLKKIGNIALGAEHVAAPIAEVLLPPFAPAIESLDSWVNRIHSSIVTIEANNPVEGQGQLKSAAVVADFKAGLDIANQVLAPAGKQVWFDESEMQNAINAFVTGYNSLAKVKQTMASVDIPK